MIRLQRRLQRHEGFGSGGNEHAAERTANGSDAMRVRPHSSLGGLTPAAPRALELNEGSTPDTLAETGVSTHRTLALSEELEGLRSAPLCAATEIRGPCPICGGAAVDGATSVRSLGFLLYLAKSSG